MNLQGEKFSIDINNPIISNTKSIIIIGMAGSGKTTFVKMLEEKLISHNKNPYLINLDPAVSDTLYESNLDIRDTINYKEVMNSHGLGPNGSIMTCLNLFSTNIHKVIDLLEKKSIVNNESDELPLDIVIVDTPGQLEVFSWSASGKMIADSFGLIYPTALLYVLDLARCQNPNTFISNMLYALSIMYKMKLPLILVLNKKDMVNENACISWIEDYKELQAALDKDTSYISSFSNSLCLTLEEFYKTIKYIPVSSKSGDGFDELLNMLFDDKLYMKDIEEKEVEGKEEDEVN